MGTGSPFQGGNVDNSNPTQVFRSVRQKISQDFSSKVSEKNNYTDLEIAINKLMKGNQAEDIQLDAMWDAIVNEMTKEFGRRLGDIERSTGNIELSDQNVKKIIDHLNVVRRRSRNGLKDSTYKAGTILKKISQINEAIKATEWLEETTVQKLRNEINEILSSLSEAVKIRDDTLKEEGNVFSQYLLDTEKDYEIFRNFNKNKYNLSWDTDVNIAQKMNELIKETSAAINVNNQKGQLMELIVAATPVVGMAAAEQPIRNIITATQQALTAAIGSTNHSPIVVDAANFDNYMHVAGIVKNGKWEIPVNSAIVATGTTSLDKVDVSMMYHNKPVNISVKNLNLQNKYGKGIHLVDGSSLLVFLQGQDGLVVNHLFNVLAEHKEKDDEDINKGLLTYAHQTLKVLGLVLAMKGHKINAQQADVFLVNDNKTGNVKIYDIDILCQKVINHLDYIKMEVGKQNVDKMSAFVNIKKYKFLKGKINKRVSATYRINDLLVDVHSRKIEVSLDKKALY